MEVEEEIAAKLHPPKCPKCGKGITYLDFTNVEDRLAKFVVHVVDGRKEYYDWESTDSLDGSERYWCPECECVLFEDEWDAIRFLKGEE